MNTKIPCIVRRVSASKRVRHLIHQGCWEQAFLELDHTDQHVVERVLGHVLEYRHVHHAVKLVDTMHANNMPIRDHVYVDLVQACIYGGQLLHVSTYFTQLIQRGVKLSLGMYLRILHLCVQQPSTKLDGFSAIVFKDMLQHYPDHVVTRRHFVALLTSHCTSQGIQHLMGLVGFVDRRRPDVLQHNATWRALELRIGTDNHAQALWKQMEDGAWHPHVIQVVSAVWMKHGLFERVLQAHQALQQHPSIQLTPLFLRHVAYSHKKIFSR